MSSSVNHGYSKLHVEVLKSSFGRLLFSVYIQLKAASLEKSLRPEKFLQLV